MKHIHKNFVQPDERAAKQQSARDVRQPVHSAKQPSAYGKRDQREAGDRDPEAERFVLGNSVWKATMPVP